MKKTRVVCVVAIWCAGCFVSAVCRANQADDEAAIRKNAEAYVDAYNKHDAKAIAGMWSPDAVYIDPDTGAESVGRDEIEKEFVETFAKIKEGKLEVRVDSVKFMSPSVAIENGIVRVIRPNVEPDETKYSAVNVKRDGKWFLDRVTEEEETVPPPSNYEHLKELEWMMGAWVDQDEDATVETDCDWTKNQNFINRSFMVEVDGQIDMAGMQLIGWDPIAKQIRSWLFDSDGGFLEGKWTRKGDRWLIQQKGFTSDGRKTSATNVMRRIDDSSFTWQSIQREVDGDMLPNVDEVLVVRKTTN